MLFATHRTRPAASRANALATRFPFKAEMDEAARAHMFPRNRRLIEA
jgi:GST-like protein